MKDELGVSLIESILIIAFAGIIVILLTNLPNAVGLINKSNHISLAREIASKQIEDKRSLSYANLTTDNSAIEDSRISLLPQGAGTVVIELCDSQTYPQFCPNGEHIKIVTVTINWRDNNKPQSVSLNTFIGEGGINQ